MIKGQKIKAVVIEVQRDHQILVSVDGRLLRVTNLSSRQFQPRDTIELIVVGLTPLELKIAGSDRGFERLV